MSAMRIYQRSDSKKFLEVLIQAHTATIREVGKDDVFMPKESLDAWLAKENVTLFQEYIYTG